ncbi:NaCP60E [Symbiodinium natans]|uniref:NaCP60E protein n=1 Tax=Symbiodinium natans TaxID=878477 RepID=A0A812PBE4_9DINO|nr:NaCP60E [Symbiodinium natans]
MSSDANKSQTQPDYRTARTTSSHVLSPTTCPSLISRMCSSWRHSFQERADGKGQKGIFEDVNGLKHSGSKQSNKEQKFADNVFGRAASHRYFEGATMAVILLNAVCIGIDADYSATNERPAKLYEGPAFFIVTEVFFAVFFTLELVVRFLGFRRKCLCLCDFWFLFDFLLVAMMDVETFILPLIASEGGPLGILSTLRLLRLLRVSRMAKLMRTFPELMLILKGLAAAVRAVSWTLALLMMILFVWSIIFTSIYHQGTKTDEEVADGIGSLFGNMSKSAFSLIIMGTLLDDVTYCCNMIRESGHIFMLAVFIVFIVISSFMMLNMLLGILVEVVASTAEGEKHKEKNGTVREAMASVLNDLGVGTQGITREKFMSMSNDPKLLKDLQELGIKQKHFQQITKLLYDSKEAEGGKDDMAKVLTGEEIVSELFRLQPGTALNFSDLATTEKKLLEQRKEIRKRIGRIENLVTIGLGKSGPAQSASCGLMLESIGPSRQMTPMGPLTPLSQMSPVSPSRARTGTAPAFSLQEGEASPGPRSVASRVNSATLQRLARTDSRMIVDEIRRRLGLKDLEAIGVPQEWCDEDFSLSASKLKESIMSSH